MVSIASCSCSFAVRSVDLSEAIRAPIRTVTIVDQIEELDQRTSCSGERYYVRSNELRELWASKKEGDTWAWRKGWVDGEGCQHPYIISSIRNCFSLRYSCLNGLWLTTSWTHKRKPFPSQQRLIYSMIAPIRRLLNKALLPSRRKTLCPIVERVSVVNLSCQLISYLIFPSSLYST